MPKSLNRTNRNARFQRGQRPTFRCEICTRMTRDTGTGVDHLCEDCFELAGLDNQINDDGDKPGSDGFQKMIAERDSRLAHIVKLGGNGEMVKASNTYLWPIETAPLHVPSARDSLLAAVTALTALNTPESLAHAAQLSKIAQALA